MFLFKKKKYITFSKKSNSAVSSENSPEICRKCAIWILSKCHDAPEKKRNTCLQVCKTACLEPSSAEKGCILGIFHSLFKSQCCSSLRELPRSVFVLCCVVTFCAPTEKKKMTQVDDAIVVNVFFL